MRPELRKCAYEAERKYPCPHDEAALEALFGRLGCIGARGVKDVLQAAEAVDDDCGANRTSLLLYI